MRKIIRARENKILQNCINKNIDYDQFSKLLNVICEKCYVKRNNFLLWKIINL